MLIDKTQTCKRTKIHTDKQRDYNNKQTLWWLSKSTRFSNPRHRWPAISLFKPRLYYFDLFAFEKL